MRAALALSLLRTLLLRMEIENIYQNKRHFQKAGRERQFLDLSRHKQLRLYVPSLGGKRGGLGYSPIGGLACFGCKELLPKVGQIVVIRPVPCLTDGIELFGKVQQECGLGLGRSQRIRERERRASRSACKGVTMLRDFF